MELNLSRNISGLCPCSMLFHVSVQCSNIQCSSGFFKTEDGFGEEDDDLLIHKNLICPALDCLGSQEYNFFLWNWPTAGEILSRKRRKGFLLKVTAQKSRRSCPRERYSAFVVLSLWLEMPTKIHWEKIILEKSIMPSIYHPSLLVVHSPWHLWRFLGSNILSATYLANALCFSLAVSFNSHPFFPN